MSSFQSWLWPNRVIGKRESGELREEHNALVNALAEARKPEDTTYNGWTNYETWCVNLWIMDEEGSNRWAWDTARTAWDTAEPNEVLTRSQVARYNLAKTIRDSVEDGNPLDGVSLYGNLLQSAIERADYDEIANNWLGDCEGCKGYERRKEGVEK